jgi:hypothetical protein
MNDILPPPAMLMDLAAGKFVTQALAAAAELNVAEQLVDGPKTARAAAPGADRKIWPWEAKNSPTSNWPFWSSNPE